MVRAVASVAVALLLHGPVTAGPVVAVLDPDRSDRVALLEAKLLADPAVTLVERTAVDAVLKEQELAAAFGPQGVGRRAALGRILKADVLVLVRKAAGVKAAALDVVVGETAGGLRLLARPVPVTADPGADAAALAAAVRAGLAKHAEAVREVVAVPPFVSRDVSFEYDHLKAALARLAEGEAAGRPGVVVVELAEAEAVAKELALAAHGTAVKRPSPLYLLGEFRHAGKPGEQKLAVALRAERGGAAVGPPRAATATPDEAAAVVRGWAAGVFDAAAGGPRPAADPTAEAKRLVARAREFERLELWAEAVTLLEASLLVVPDQPLVREAIIDDTRAASMRFHDPDFAAVVRETQKGFRRSVDHLAAYVRSAVPVRNKYLRIHQLWGAATQGAREPFADHWPPDKFPEMAESRRYAVAVLGSMASTADARRGGCLFYGLATRGLPVRERYDFQVELVRRIQDLSGREERVAVEDLVTSELLYLDKDPRYAEYRRYLGRLVERCDGRVAAMAAKKLAAIAHLDLAWAVGRDPFASGPYVPPAPPPGAAFGPDPGRVRLRPAAVTVDGGPDDAARFAQVRGVQAAGPGADLFWGAEGALFLMTRKGTVRPVWRGPDPVPGQPFLRHMVVNTCFDGRYAWVSFDVWRLTADARGLLGYSTALLAVDPAAGKVWPVTAADGLPAPPREEHEDAPLLKVAPLGPGRVCAAGYLGPSHPRGWVAVVTLDAAAGKAGVDLLHEARERPTDANARSQSPAVAFVPRLLAAVRDDGPGGGVRVVVVRDDGRRPLVIDPAARTVAVAAFDLHPTGLPEFRFERAGGDRRAVLGGGFLVKDAATVKGKTVESFVRVRFPAAGKEKVVTPARFDGECANTSGRYYGYLTHGGRIYVVEPQSEVVVPAPTTGPEYARNPKYGYYSRWWVIDPAAKTYRPAAARTAAVLAAGASSHYGFLAVVEDVPHRKSSLAAVEID